MSHEIAKLLLEHADRFLERTEAVKSAMSLGMPLAEIEAYLDWIDRLRNPNLVPAAMGAGPDSDAPGNSADEKQ